LEYFDMAVTGLPGHYLNVPADPNRRQEVRVSVPGSMVVTPLIPMLGSELVKLPGVQRNKVPSDKRAVRAISGLLRGFMSDDLNRKTDYQGFAHLDDVKRELLTGKFSRIVAQWDVLTFMSIGAFDDKDRFEFLCAVDLSLSIIDSQTVPFKMRCVQGHQKKFLENRDPCIGASRVFCLEERKELFAARLYRIREQRDATQNVPSDVCNSRLGDPSPWLDSRWGWGYGVGEKALLLESLSTFGDWLQVRCQS